MIDLLLIFALAILAAFFWQLRQMAEISKKFIERECLKQNVQFIAIAQESAKPHIGGHSGLSWKNKYMFEFSTDGLNQFKGELWMQGKKITKITWPIFPEPEWQHAPQFKNNSCGNSSRCNSSSCR